MVPCRAVLHLYFEKKDYWLWQDIDLPMPPFVGMELDCLSHLNDPDIDDSEDKVESLSYDARVGRMRLYLGTDNRDDHEDVGEPWTMDWLRRYYKGWTWVPEAGPDGDPRDRI
jgi:hypothetical protein